MIPECWQLSLSLSTLPPFASTLPPFALPISVPRRTSLFVSTKSPIIPTSTYLWEGRRGGKEGGKKGGKKGGRLNMHFLFVSID